MIIRNQSIDTALSRSSKSDISSDRVYSSKKPRRTHGSISGTAIASYLGVFLLVMTMVAVAYQPPVNTSARADASVAPQTQQHTPTVQSSVDQVMATNLASSLAESTGMPISNNVANLSQSLAVESAMAQTEASVISKPQIIQPTAGSRSTQQYTTVAGDTVPSVAAKYGISATTLKWANNLTSDALEPGRNLTIMPVDGVLYKVKEGDTVDSIVSKYGSDRQSVMAYNDLELTGNPVAGSQIIVPGGNLPDTERPGYVGPRGRRGGATLNYAIYSGGYGSSYKGSISVGNKYAWGNCTWYAYERRIQLGRPIGSFWGNASTWAYSARSAGLRVDGNPEPGSIMQNGGGYGHVAIVESVNPGVSITISEMNGYRFGGGFARVGHGDVPWGEATSGMYRYIH